MAKMSKAGNIVSDADEAREREMTDRRERPTPVITKFWLSGRRRGGRRDGETANIYVDQYERSEIFLVAGVLILSLLDMVFTIVHLNAGGTEANPAMAWILAVGGQQLFIVVKTASTFIGVFVLLVHVRFRRVRPLLTFAFLMYLAIFAFHLYLGHLRATGGGI